VAELNPSKICTKCKIEQSLDNFNIEKRLKSGLTSSCKKCISERYKKYYLTIQNKKKSQSKERRISCKEKVNESNRKWRQNNIEKAKSTARLNYNVKIKNNPKFALRQRIKRLIQLALTTKTTRKNSKTEIILGCTIDYFKRHIEKQFTDGMNWDNRKDWHLDHITPMASAKDYNEMIRLNHFTNLRPLWADENMSKSDKIIFLL
jgi:hypothetical protein